MAASAAPHRSPVRRPVTHAAHRRVCRCARRVCLAGGGGGGGGGGEGHRHADLCWCAACRRRTRCCWGGVLWLLARVCRPCRRLLRRWWRPTGRRGRGGRGRPAAAGRGEQGGGSVVDARTGRCGGGAAARWGWRGGRCLPPVGVPDGPLLRARVGRGGGCRGADTSRSRGGLHSESPPAVVVVVRRRRPGCDGALGGATHLPAGGGPPRRHRRRTAAG